MKSNTVLAILASALAANAATIPPSPWTTLTPTGSIPSSVGALTAFSGSFALSIIELGSAPTPSPSKKKRDAVTQIGDGQIQDQTTLAQPTISQIAQISDGQIQDQTTAAAVQQIGDGQVQDQTTAAAVAQISDGQIQDQTTAAAVAQISDGQIQQQTASVLAQIGDGQVQQQTTAAVVAQIGDGQIQQHTTAAAVQQIGDGQIQQHTTAAGVAQISDGQIQQQPTKTTAAGVGQISDGQIQQTTAAGVSQISDGQVQQTTAAGQATQVTDGQVQATGSSGSGSGSGSSGSSQFEQTCEAPNSLVLKLDDGILTDSHGRIGAIVANRQFQFDGPPPQAGSIFAKGWSIVPLDYVEDSHTQSEGDNASKDKSKRAATWGKLALGAQTTFYRCLSGDFYNLYDESIGGQCSEVEFAVLEIVAC